MKRRMGEASERRADERGGKGRMQKRKQVKGGKKQVKEEMGS